MMRNLLKSLMVALWAMLGAADHGQAAAIPITNASFEEPVLAVAAYSSGIPGWITTGEAGVQNLTGLTDWYPALPDGKNVAVLSQNADIRQTVASVVAVGAYTLSAYVGNGGVINDPRPFALELWAGTVKLTEVTGTVPVGVLTKYSCTYNAIPGSASLGQPLEIRIRASTSGAGAWTSTNIDGVSLVCTTQNMVNGSFSSGTLLPWSVTTGSPIITSLNSPFTNVYASNGKCLQITKPSGAKGILASYQFGALAADTVTINYDFMLQKVNASYDVLAVQNPQSTSNAAIFQMGNGSSKFTLIDGSGTLTLTTLATYSWYNVQATFSRSNWSYSGKIVKSGGATVSWSNRALSGTPSSLGCFLFDQWNPTSTSNVIRYDNFSVTTPSPAKHEAFRHNGTPFFPIGVYGSPTPTGYPVVQYAYNETNAPELAAAGFNCYILPTAWLNPPNLDYAAQCGLKVIAAGNEDTKYMEDAAQFVAGSAFDQKIQAMKAHSALLAYYGIDEPLGQGVWGTRSYADWISLLVGGRQFVESRDPNHPLILNEAAFNVCDGMTYTFTYNKQGCRDFAAGAQVYSMDTYPYGGSTSDLTAVEKNVDACLEVTPSTKPVFAVLQGQAWNECDGSPQGSRPSLAATRFMAYSAIIHGATGVLWWGTDWIEPSSQLWADIKSVAHELSLLQNMLAAGSESTNFTLVNPDLEGLRKEHSGYHYLIVANRGFGAVTSASLTASGFNLANNGGKVRVAFENRLLTPFGSSWTDSFTAWGVHVYTDHPNL